MRYIIVQDGTVINAIEWDGTSNYLLPQGTTLTQDDMTPIGAVLPYTLPPNGPPDIDPK